MTAGRPTLCSYQLDDQLRLVAVGDGWAAFAEANSASHLVTPPLGEPLLSFVTDPTTAHIYERLFERAARRRRAVTFAIRCDSPNRRRYLDLRLAPQPHGGFVITTVLLHEERHPAGWLLSAGAARNPSRFVSLCSWCNRIDAGGDWCELEEGISRLRLFEGEPPALTHGICPTCATRMHALLDTL